MTGVTTSGYLMPPPGTVIEQRGPFGFLRRRVIVTSPTPVVPAGATEPTPKPGVEPAGGTSTPPSKLPMPTAATTGGVITSGYVVPPDGTVTVVPARYTWRPFFSSRWLVDPGATYATPGSVAPATYVVPRTTTRSYYYPRYGTSGYFGWSGFGFGWR
jgi:hypothetical protein